MEKSKGLGDTVEKITTITGIKPLIEYITADVLKLKIKTVGVMNEKKN
jgi:hypothetical protein